MVKELKKTLAKTYVMRYNLNICKKEYSDCLLFLQYVDFLNCVFYSDEEGIVTFIITECERMFIMKKPYSCPMLAFESYQLDAAIAKKCPEPIHFYTYTCSHDLGGGGITGPVGGGEFFNYYNCQTDLVGDGPENNESVCYHGPYATFDITEIFLNS